MGRPKGPPHPPLSGPDDPRHGTPHCYCHLKCRCPRCRSGWAIYQRKVRARNPPCTVPGCTNTQSSRGLCGTHYSRQRKGLPLDTPIKKQKARARLVM